MCEPAEFGDTDDPKAAVAVNLNLVGAHVRP